MIQQSVWYRKNNLILNTSKTKEMIVDYRRKKGDIQPLFIGGDCVERVHDFWFLGVHLRDDLTWNTNTTATIKKTETPLPESTQK